MSWMSGEESRGIMSSESCMEKMVIVWRAMLRGDSRLTKPSMPHVTECIGP